MTQRPTLPKPIRGLAARIGNPLAWSEADKCLVVVAIILSGMAVIEVVRRAFGGWLYMAPQVDPSLGQLEDRLALAAFGVWGLLGLWGLWIRKRVPRGRAYVWLTVNAYSLTVAVLLWLSGPFHSPGWILVLAGAVIGFLLFGKLALVGLAGFFLLTLFAVVGGELGWLGTLPIASHAPPIDSEPWRRWVWRMGITSFLFASLSVALFAYVVSMLRDREAQLLRISKTDGLTQLSNRRYFMELLEAELVRSRRYPSPVSCVMIDLDHFKEVNDSHGHLAGDRVLVGVADAIRRAVRDTDSVARYGGEEFVVLLPNTELEGARELAERCRALIAESRFEYDGGSVGMTASMGVATARGGAGIDELLGAADAALYRAKRSGRDRVVVAGEAA